jgi:phage host-nuclease inhibitor protein Gam
MARAKKVVIPTIEDSKVPEVLGQYAQATSHLKKLEAELELKIKKLRDQQQSKIDELVNARTEAFNMLNQYADKHKDDLFAKRRSKEYAHGTIGYRIGTPKVKPKGITLKKALDLIKTMNLPFVRTKEEIDKDKIIASREDEGVMTKLSKIGLHVVQDETFYVETKDEELN